MTDRRRQRVHYIAGASGSGTSTRAFQLRRTWEAEPAARQVHVVATDVVRAQLRTVLDLDANPDLWGESFNLAPRDGDHMRDGVNIDAFLRQCAPILRAVEASVAYALTEGWDVIAEGVHLVPGQFTLAPPSDAETSYELLTVEHEDEHRDRFTSRDVTSAGARAADHYIANIGRIRTIQDELIERLAASRSSGWAPPV